MTATTAFIKYTHGDEVLHRTSGGAARTIQDWHREDAAAWMAVAVADGIAPRGPYALTMYVIDFDLNAEVVLDRAAMVA